jgi:predicted lipoprotein with Yx(FWY)xxD motif
MHTSKVRYFAVAALAAMALAACSSSSKSANDTTPTSPVTAGTTTVPTSTGGGTTAKTTVAVADSKFGKILVDANGMTLYVDEKDKPGAPACTGACLTAWPPLTATGAPTAAADVTGKLATVKASDGTTQVTVNGSPLYHWQGDKKAGDATGQDVEGFYVVKTSGEKYDPGSGDAS